MSRKCLALLALALAAIPSASNAQAVRSAYSDFDLGRCRTLTSHPDEADSGTYRCPGLGNRPVFVSQGDLRFDLDVGADDSNFETGIPFNTLGPRVEWRMRGNQPIAIIYRLNFATSEQPIPSVLVVKSVGPNGRSGCIAAFVLGTLPDANARARTLADSARSFPCGQNREVPLIGFNW